MVDSLAKRNENTIGERRAFLNFFHALWSTEKKAVKFIYSLARVIAIVKNNSITINEPSAEGDTLIVVINGLVTAYAAGALFQKTDIRQGRDQSVFIWERKSEDSATLSFRAIENSVLFLISTEKLKRACQMYPVLDNFLFQLIFPDGVRSLKCQLITV
ncbi:hypothetical protein OC25_03315 [Pedobacter kyungheensis]|uniref:Cyclic nucleotide-binding domain-containing protein n=1 Tax=Pedobacter kyungheensis TaxID=1069985 RepID=A0A0C1DET0_9SPHI|nr:hypothetical protein [Pedobacter kyungheensis]KIA96136.1 hypothetical protein OC25_03315 [Pedobacter kyungheensis]